MRKIHFLTLLAVLGIGLVFTSCKDKDKPKDPVSVNTITIDATAYDAWVYFSFKEGEVVEVADFATSTAWDIGFHRYDLRVNGGEAGPGEGGTFATGENNFAAVTTAPESGYVSNDFIDVAVDVTVMPPVMEHVPGDQVLATWVTMTYGQQGPEYTYSNEIFVVKTADGKYAKVWLKDYFNADGESGHVTMKYSYQPDGSTKLD